MNTHLEQLKHPQILTCSDLLSGDVLYMGAQGWSRSHRAALIVKTKPEAAELLARGQADMAANRVLDVYLVDVAVLADGTPDPLHYREKIRAYGPTVRLDLGKQADATFVRDI